MEQNTDKTKEDLIRERNQAVDELLKDLEKTIETVATCRQYLYSLKGKGTAKYSEEEFNQLVDLFDEIAWSHDESDESLKNIEDNFLEYPKEDTENNK